jgi:hypothetical protein
MRNPTVLIRLKRLALVLVAVSALGQSDSELKEAQRHYKVALEALGDNNLSIAAEELGRSAALAPSNALVRYYLASVQSRQNLPGPALDNLTRAMSLGLPTKESGLAEDLLAKLQYQFKKAEADASHATPQKLIGLYQDDSLSSSSGGWKTDPRVDVHETRDSVRTWDRTLSLNVVDGSHITGFVKVDRTYTHEFGCSGSTGSHLNHKNSENETKEAGYFFVSLTVGPEGEI